LQEALGRLLGQDQQYVSKLEGGKVQDITMSRLRKLRQALSCSADSLQELHIKAAGKEDK